MKKPKNSGAKLTITAPKISKTALHMPKTNLLERLWEESWTHIKTVVDTVREPFLILDKDLRVIVANDSFYGTFQTKVKDTENMFVYELGNGQWNIPALRKLLEEVLPKNSFFKGFEVTHVFPLIGRKIMILNARQIHAKDSSQLFPPIILLAIEDVTGLMAIAEKLATHTTVLEKKLQKRTRELELQIFGLEKEVNELKFRKV